MPAVAAHRAVDGRAGLGRDGVHQEPRTAARGRCRGLIPAGDHGRPGGQAAALDRTFLGGWHADRRLDSTKSFRPKDGSDEPPPGTGGNAERDRGEKRSNETHASTTDPDARLYRKSNGSPSRLCFMGHLLIENRHGLIVDARTTHATGRAGRERRMRPAGPGARRPRR